MFISHSLKKIHQVLKLFKHKYSDNMPKSLNINLKFKNKNIQNSYKIPKEEVSMRCGYFTLTARETL